MPKNSVTKHLLDEHLEILEKVKEQYQQYVEVSGLYELPTQNDDPVIQYQPPSLEHPLTTNTLQKK